MKLKSIASICKKDKRVHLYNRMNEEYDTATQYIGTTTAVYAVGGLPELNDKTVLTILDIGDSQKESYFVSESTIPTWLNIDDNSDGEMLLERCKFSIIYGGKVLIPLRSQDGILFIDNRLLSPMSDVADALELYERNGADGNTYIVAKVGFLLAAVIMPFKVVTEDFMIQIEDFITRCECTLEKEKASEEADHQDKIEDCFIEPNTGEVIQRSTT